MKQLFALVILLGALIGLAQSAEAAKYWISPAGSDANACGSIVGAADPGVYKASPMSAMTCLASGDTLEMKAGTYTGTGARIYTPTVSVPDGTAGAYTTIEGAGAGVTIWQQSGAVPYNSIANPHYIRVQGFTIDGVNGAQANDSACWNWFNQPAVGNHIEVLNMELKNCHHGIYGHVDDAIVRNNNVHDIGQLHSGGTYAQGNGVYILGARALLEFNTFYNVGTKALSGYSVGIQIWESNPGSADNCVVRNNTVYDSTGGMAIRGNGCKVYNNTVSSNTTGIQLYRSNILVANNVIYNSAGVGFYDGPFSSNTGNVLINNHIVANSPNITIGATTTTTQTTNRTTGVIGDCANNAAVRDFTQKVGSSCINQGTAVSGLAFNTYSGKTKPDIGAFDTFSYSGASVNENLMDVTVGLSHNTPVSPASGQTTWIALKSAVARGTTSANILAGSSSVVRITFNGAVCAGGETWTVTYTASNVTDSANIGGFNQPMTAFTAQAVTNGCGSTPPADPGTPWIYYKLDENTGTNANDESANNLDGTLTNGPTWAAGKQGFAVSMVNSGDDYIAVPYGNAVNPSTQSLTSCVGLLPDAGLESSSRIAWGAPLGTNQRFYVGWEQGTWGMGIQASPIAVNNEFTVSAGWTYVCLVADSATDTATLYVNGVAGTSAQSVKAYTSYALSGNIQLGALPTFTNGGVTVDEYKVYTSALSAANILTLYQAWEPPAPPSTCTLAQSAHQWSLLRQNAGHTLDAYGVQSATVKIVKGGSIILTTQVNCTVAGGTIGQKLRYNLDGGAFLEVPDVMGPDGVAFYGSAAITDPDILKSTVSCCLIAGLTAIDGATQWTAAATPVTAFTTGSSTVQRRILRIDPAITATTVCFKEYDQTGNAFGSYTPSAGACLTVIPQQAGMGF